MNYGFRCSYIIYIYIFKIYYNCVYKLFHPSTRRIRPHHCVGKQWIYILLLLGRYVYNFVRGWMWTAGLVNVYYRYALWYRWLYGDANRWRSNSKRVSRKPSWIKYNIIIYVYVYIYIENNNIQYWYRLWSVYG